MLCERQRLQTCVSQVEQWWNPPNSIIGEEHLEQDRLRVAGFGFVNSWVIGWPEEHNGAWGCAWVN